MEGKKNFAVFMLTRILRDRFGSFAYKQLRLVVLCDCDDESLSVTDIANIIFCGHIAIPFYLLCLCHVTSTCSGEVEVVSWCYMYQFWTLFIVDIVSKEEPEPLGQRAALISVSLALSQTPACTTRPRIWG